MKIAVASGKGGTGKTLISTNLFSILQKRNIHVTLIDCDAEEPNVAEFLTGEQQEKIQVTQKIPQIDTQKCTFCGKCKSYCSYNAIVMLQPAHYIKVVEDLCHDCGACLVACEFNAITEKDKELGWVTHFKTSFGYLTEARANVGIYSPVPVIKMAIKTSNHDGFVIMDSPPGISCPFIATVEDADFVVLVTEPTPFGLNDLKLSVETLLQLNKQFGVVINRSGLGDKSIYKYLKQNAIPLLMEIPFDKRIAEVYSNGFLIVEQLPEYKQPFETLFEKIEQSIKHLKLQPNLK